MLTGSSIESVFQWGIDRRRLLAVMSVGIGAVAIGRVGAGAQGTPTAGGKITIYSGRSEDLVALICVTADGCRLGRARPRSLYSTSAGQIGAPKRSGFLR